MATIIQWGDSIQYTEQQVVEYKPVLSGQKIAEFERIFNKPILFLRGSPLKGYKVKLLLSSWQGGNCPSVQDYYEALENRYLQGISADLIVAGTNKGKHVIDKLNGEYPYLAPTGKPYIARIEIEWKEDPL